MLVGDDDDRCARRVTVDADPVDWLSEVVAVLSGRASYELHERGSRVDIYWRHDWRIKQRDERAHKAVHLEHKCERG